MPATIITKEDLAEFRLQLLDDIREMIKPAESKIAKPWLKNTDVMKLLSISDNTLRRFRISGRLRSHKAGGRHYYKYEDIEKMLNGNAA